MDGLQDRDHDSLFARAPTAFFPYLPASHHTRVTELIILLSFLTLHFHITSICFYIHLNQYTHPSIIMHTTTITPAPTEITSDINSDQQMSTANREDSVYLAKLAEQAERYEGKSLSLFFCACDARRSVTLLARFGASRH